MPPPNDGSSSPFEPPLRPLSTSSLRPVSRASTGGQSIASSISSLPYRPASTSASSLFASTSTPGSRSISPNGSSTPTRMLAGSVFGSFANDSYMKPADRPEDPRNLISQAFVPHIAVHTSTDTKELVQDKGFAGGLWELLRPFGDRIQGKVNIRDSIGASRICEDFTVRFVELGDGLQTPDESRRVGEAKTLGSNGSTPIATNVTPERAVRTGGDRAKVEELVDRHLAYAETFGNGNIGGSDLDDGQSAQVDSTSPFYTLYLRRLLSGIPLAPHETFSHPVACVIAISSRNRNPIETLKNLYDESTRGEKRVPIWVNNDYLRYYILVHDEERDDIGTSIALFDKMKRSFGLHCHLLRLRSSQCVATDDDSVQMPRSDWMAAAEEAAEIEKHDDIEDSSPYIYESDITAIKTFIREMVTQSVVPSMERCVALWNDQVASKRRGISGRLMTMSKKWPFGSGRSSTGAGYGASGSNSNYDSFHGFYRPDSPEAIMRKLADYAFMLRDYKLAQSIYDLLRSDFSNDKAWRYHAAVNEMSAISQLMLPQSMSSKVRAETVDQMLETASYSYVTRCSESYGALRCLTLGMELLRLRGGSAIDDAARWGVKLLESKVVGPIGDALIKERIAACYSTKKGTGSELWGSRIRKSALWSILAADAWLALDKPKQAQQRLEEAMRKYASLPHKDSLSHFSMANDFIQGLHRDVQASLQPLIDLDDPPEEETEIETTVDEETEAFKETRSHRRSLMGAIAPPLAGLESAPLHGTMLEEESVAARPDNFESD
ncbi:ER-golgi trafficking TRAPP I complex 85 kDa subunit-domain-containing protein [Xylogone sp. PMI_703]|nr:ER-golgi trafficking TRAPP I complex 85 kDa subunit-domain-containing protein [Xylogone sp. PMI_703]